MAGPGRDWQLVWSICILALLMSSVVAESDWRVPDYVTKHGMATENIDKSS